MDEQSEQSMGEGSTPSDKEPIQIEQSIAREIKAQGDLLMIRSVAGLVNAEHDLQATSSAAAAMVAGGNLTLSNGGAAVMVAGGETTTGSLLYRSQ